VLLLLLWHGFDPWPENFCTAQKKNKKDKFYSAPNAIGSFFSFSKLKAVQDESTNRMTVKRKKKLFEALLYTMLVLGSSKTGTAFCLVATSSS